MTKPDDDNIEEPPTEYAPEPDGDLQDSVFNDSEKDAS